MVTSQSSRVSSSNGRAMSTPALFTSTSISPSAPRPRSTRSPAWSGAATSAAAPAAVTPWALSSPSVASTLSPAREQIPTRYPARPSASAVARPIPSVAPVTSAVPDMGGKIAALPSVHGAPPAASRGSSQLQRPPPARGPGRLLARAGASPQAPAPPAAAGVGDRAAIRGRHPGAAGAPLAGAARGALGRQAHRGRSGDRGRNGPRGRCHSMDPAGPAAPARARDRAGGGRPLPGERATGESARRPVREPHQRGADATCGHPRPGAVRGFGGVRQAGASPAADGWTDRPLFAAAGVDPGRDHAGHPRRGARGLRALAAAPPGDRGSPIAAGGNALRLTRLFAALFLDAGAAPARLPAVHRRQ